MLSVMEDATRTSDDRNMMTPTADQSRPSREEMDTCLRALERAQSDTEVFAAMLLVSKVVRAERTDVEIRKRIFDAVGFKFINRMFKTAKNPDRADSQTYRNLGLTLLGCFITIPGLASHPQMISKIPLFLEIIHQTSPRSLDDGEQKWMIDDTYEILVAMALELSLLKAPSGPDVVPVLCDVCLKQCYGCDKAQHVLLVLLHQNGTDIWRRNTTQLTKLLCDTAKRFQECQDDAKFQMCETLSRYLSACSEVATENSEWSEYILNGVRDILKSKVAEKHRDPALCLSSLTAGHQGISWALGPNQQDTKFFLLLIHLACVETRMALENPDPRYRQSKESVLVACFSLLEQCIEYLTCSPALALDDRQVVQLHAAMAGAFGAVVFYLQGAQFDESWPSQPLVVAAVRVLCVWLAEETTALKEQVYQLLPFLIRVVRKSFREATAGSVAFPDPTLAPTPTDGALLPSGNASRRGPTSTDLLRLLLPALCHLTAEDEPREILLEEGGAELLGECFSHHWQRFVAGDKDGDSEIAMTTMCSIFLNVALQDAEAVQNHSDVFNELLQLLAGALSQLASDMEHLILSFNMAVLGLTLLRTLALHKEIQDLSGIWKFVVRTLDLFRYSYHINDDGLHDVCRDYRPYWNDVAELWLLGTQVLSECLVCIAWLPTVCLQSGYLQHVIDLLKKVAAESVEEEVLVVYSALLGSCSKTEVCGKLCEMGAMEIARKYKLEELSVNLQM